MTREENLLKDILAHAERESENHVSRIQKKIYKLPKLFLVFLREINKCGPGFNIAHFLSDLLSQSQAGLSEECECNKNIQIASRPLTKFFK